MKKIIIFFIIFIFPCSLFSANFEFALGGGIGTTIDFSQIVVSLNLAKAENGSRTDSGFSANAFIDIGANFELQNAGALSSVSVLFETGYYYYMRIRSKFNYATEKRHRFIYQNLILGVLPKLNFDYGISLGIGAGIFLPLCGEIIQKGNEYVMGLGSYSGETKLNSKQILYMYKVPIMPYIKLTLERNFYILKSFSFKVGGNILYNFGMEFDMDNLRKNTDMYTHNKYNFSSLAFEVFLGFGFGRPR